MPALTAGTNLMLYGKWVLKMHTVSFDLNGGTFDGANSITAVEVESGTQVTEPSGTLEKQDAVFGYWTLNGKRFSFDTAINGDITLVAHWNNDNSVPLTVAYNANGGTGTFTDSTVYQAGSYAKIAGQPAPPPGKIFTGWKVGDSDVIIAGGTFQVNTADAVSGVVTLTAQYADMPVHKTSVIYNLNGGNINGSTDNIVEENAVINGDYTVGTYAPKKDGFTFAGWNTDANGEGSTFRSGNIVASGRDINILYAQWTRVNVKVQVKIKGNKLEKKYNGEVQEAEGFEIEVTEVSLRNLLLGTKGSEKNLSNAVSVKLKNDKKASRKDVGTTYMNLTEDDFIIEPADGYEVVGEPTVIDGSLTINKRTITLTSAMGKKVYDGTPLTKNAQTDITVGGDGFVTGEGATYDITGTQTDAGDSDNNFTYTLNSNTKSDNYDITTSLGTLTVTRKGVTVKANNSSKQFGAADPVFTASVTGLIGEDEIDYKVTRPRAGKDEAVGTYPGAIVPSGAATQGNYTVTYVNGNFTISASDDLTLTVTDYTGTYDGQPHGSAAVASVMDGTTIQYSVDGGKNWSMTVPQIKDAGTINVTAKATATGYAEKTATYTLTVTPARVTVTTGSANKEYDGMPLTNDAASISGLVTGETATVTATGSQTEVGSSNNTYSIDWITAKKGNYTVNEELGTLKVTTAYVDVTVEKEWNDGDNKDKIRPEEVTVVLLMNGDMVPDYMPVTLSEDNEWTHTWEKLPKYDGTEEIRYSVDEMEVPEGYTAEVDGSVEKGFTVTNTHTPKQDNNEEITPLTMVNVKISGNTKKVTYDGNEQEVTGFTYEVEKTESAPMSLKTMLFGTKGPEDDLNDAVKVTLKDGRTARAAGTNAGSYYMGLSLDDFDIEAAAGYGLAADPIVTDGWLEIVPTVDPDKPEQKGDDVPENDPEKKSDVLGDYEDDSNDSKGAVKTADSGKSAGGGPKTGDSNRMFLYIEILSLAVISLIMLIAGRREEEESE